MLQLERRGVRRSKEKATKVQRTGGTTGAFSEDRLVVLWKSTAPVLECPSRCAPAYWIAVLCYRFRLGEI